jgi:hypothetical protein
LTAATNRNFYRKQEQPEALRGEGKYVVYGFSKSARVTDAGPMLCVERERVLISHCISRTARTTSMFFDNLVIDLLFEIGLLQPQSAAKARIDKRMTDLITNQFKGLRVQVQTQYGNTTVIITVHTPRPRQTTDRVPRHRRDEDQCANDSLRMEQQKK